MKVVYLLTIILASAAFAREAGRCVIPGRENLVPLRRPKTSALQECFLGCQARVKASLLARSAVVAAGRGHVGGAMINMAVSMAGYAATNSTCIRSCRVQLQSKSGPVPLD